MAVFKCKMCGGTLEINNNETVATCEYCGTKQTLPKLDDDRRANLYDRANHFRRCNEFDKAAAIYEQILSDDNTDAESYWSLVLCRYGIEYVEDPKTRKRIPTINRAQYSSIFADEDYKSALQYADGYQSEIYQQEATAIDEIQKGILAISQKEEPFDVFICYKETDNYGRRTPDSVYAQDIYKALTEEGYKVFFSRITLEDKLGTAYEPYIFAALNSAKVMLIVGTKPEHFNAVWVKNEWSRYLALVKSGKKKTIIPIYAEISPYDLPEELSYIQAQDMTKIGFMQDLVRGINKIIPLKKSNPINGSVENQMVDSMLQKALHFINSGDFKSANLCLDTVHAYDVDNAMYYVYQLMIQNDCKNIEKINEIKSSIVDTEAYINAVNYADDELKEFLISCGYHTLYNEAFHIYNNKSSISDFKKAINLIERINVDTLLLSEPNFASTINNLKDKIEKKISEIEEQERKIKKELKEKEAKKQRQAKTIKKISIISVIVLIFISLTLSTVIFWITPSSNYKKGNVALEKGDYETAISYYAKSPHFKDVADKMYNIEQGKLKYAQAGDEVKFGIYSTDNGIFKNNYSSIEWIVLKRNVDSVLLISKECLTAKPYNSELKEIQWGNSSLFDWLNTEFKNIAFSEKESNCLISNITILSMDEIDEYFPTAESKRVLATEYAKKAGIQVAENGYSCWWVRGDSISATEYPVLSTGEYGEPLYVTNAFVGVRPVINIKIDLSENEFNKLSEENKSQIYNEALEQYNKKDLEGALNKFVVISEYKDSQNYIYEIKLTLAQPKFDSGNYLEYQNTIQELVDAGYEPAIKAYNKAQKEIDATNAKAEAEKNEVENAMKALNGMWKWQNFFGYYMEIKDGVISYGTNADKSVNHADEFWYDNYGTIEYDPATKSYKIKDFMWAEKLTFDGAKIKMYDEYGDPPSFFDGYATKYK